MSRCWIEIDSGALRHNAHALRAFLGDGVRIAAVVKADAYGHGVAHVVPALRDKVEVFAVACVSEARSVRALAPVHPILLMSVCTPEERPLAVAGGFVPAISSAAEAIEFARFSNGSPVVVHMVVDTGMGRIGVWEDAAEQLALDLRAMPQITVGYISTHLPVADEDEAYTREQLDRFAALSKRLRGILGGAVVLHSLNSAGIIGFGSSAGDMARAGLALYGISPLPGHQPGFRQAMTWKTRVTLLRDIGAGRGISYGRTFVSTRSMRVATLSAGYADGYPRHLSGKGACVLIGGIRCPVLGRVTMDQIVVDVGDVRGVEPGDEAVLCGRQGDEEILASELAERAGTIAWEIFTRASQIDR
jgi:alanine racemase